MIAPELGSVSRITRTLLTDTPFQMPARAYILIAISNVNRANRFRQLVSATLRLDSVVVRDGEEALQEMARRGAPSLLIVDLSLPRVDGFAVVRKVRRQATDADTRVVVVAGHESLLAAARELSTSLSISSILPLDVDEDTLREALTAEGEAIQQAAGVAAPAAVNPRVARTLDANDVLDRAAIEIRRRFSVPVSISYLRLGEQESMTLQVAALHPDAAAALSDISEFKFLKQVADAAEPLVIPSIEHHPVFAQYLAKGPRPIRGLAAVPVAIARSDARGALCVLDTKLLELSAADVDAMATFGKSVGAEIDRLLTPLPNDSGPVDINVEEVKALQYLASTDPLTGIANRRGGEKHIANEISRAKRERRPLSCVLLDIDRFKQVNDTYGHQAGDQLLRDIGTLLRRTVRAYDILVRWGGEEFLMVLPGVDLDTARLLAERVRVAVEALDTHGIGGVTISGGVAKFEIDYDFAATLKTADQRLYQAKKSGRNRIV